MRKVKYIRLSLVSSWAVMAFSSTASAGESVLFDVNAPPEPAISLSAQKKSIWQNAVGEGFQSTTHTLSLETGAALGMATLGSRQAHDLALVGVSCGLMIGPVLGETHWYRGNLELRAELFGGIQFSPSIEWLVGLTPHLRYNFATGTRLIPFIDVGAGVTGTGIGLPDLSNAFEFNLQATTGMHWFVRDKLALTVEARYLHISCGGISQPNCGLNSVIGMVGLTWFF